MLTKTTEYALRAMIYLALHASPDKKIGIKEVAQELDIPMAFIGKILQELVRKGLLASTKGPHGGFFLERPARAITIMDVIREIDGLEAFKRCGLGLKKCSDNHPCPLHQDFKIYRDGLARLFSQRTIQDLIASIENGEAFLTNLDFPDFKNAPKTSL
ncbi:RrF2 family transcriptional regulator [Adhaeribacter soli]|uniref:Rrf2 family transcriptional regulator n=1 Tax=Adhaeribacter soli TaxID=2607655 RepID=A0A5N1IJ29_9BACT|nr:Rrf2 family transcriptional regulator [Adhaeribacter soli]KAA9325673.1 Rrf2 family transcriptional regulator [Adhaeribacter soli]